MNLILLDWSENAMHVIRNIPENLCGEKLEEFIAEKCEFPIGSVDYLLMEDDDPIYFKTYNPATNSIIQDAVDCFGAHF